VGKDVFKVLRAVHSVQTKTAAQKAVLVALAVRANFITGSCRPSYDRLAHDTCLSRSVVIEAVRYLRDDLKVVTWKTGHGSNQYTRPKCNVYDVNFRRILQLAESAERTYQARFAESDSEGAESDSALAESASRTLTAQDKTAQVSNCSGKGAGAPEVPFLPQQPDAGKGKPPSEAVSPPAGLSDKTPDFAAWDRDSKSWGARRNIGRALTIDEVMQIKWLNHSGVRPN